MLDRAIKSAVVTGPTGAIGIALCRLLAEQNVAVYAVHRPGSLRAGLLPQNRNIQVIAYDMGVLEQLPAKLPDHVDAFYHFAWAHTIGSGRNDMSAQIDNIRYTIHAVHCAAKLGCQIFIGAGSQAEYGRTTDLLQATTPCFPENGYGMAKLCAGQMSRVECQKLGIAHVWPRILSVYGPGDGPHTMISTVIQKLLTGQRPALTAGEQLWDYLYADDAARALWLLALHGISGHVYPLGSGQARPLSSYIKELRDAIDPTLSLGFGEIPYGEQQVMHLQADIIALQKDVAFSPQISFAEGIRRTIQSYKEPVENVR